MSSGRRRLAQAAVLPGLVLAGVAGGARSAGAFPEPVSPGADPAGGHDCPDPVPLTPGPRRTIHWSFDAVVGGSWAASQQDRIREVFDQAEGFLAPDGAPFFEFEEFDKLGGEAPPAANYILIGGEDIEIESGALGFAVCAAAGDWASITVPSTLAVSSSAPLAPHVGVVVGHELGHVLELWHTGRQDLWDGSLTQGWYPLMSTCHGTDEAAWAAALANSRVTADDFGSIVHKWWPRLQPSAAFAHPALNADPGWENAGLVTWKKSAGSWERRSGGLGAANGDWFLRWDPAAPADRMWTGSYLSYPGVAFEGLVTGWQVTYRDPAAGGGSSSGLTMLTYLRSVDYPAPGCSYGGELQYVQDWDQNAPTQTPRVLETSLPVPVVADGAWHEVSVDWAGAVSTGDYPAAVVELEIAYDGSGAIDLDDTGTFAHREDCYPGCPT